VRVIFGVDITGWRIPEGEWFASSSSMTSSLSDVVQKGLCVGCGLMNSHRVVVPSSTVVMSMASLERDFALVEHSRDGHTDCEVEVTSEALRTRRLFGYYRGVGDDGG
jgi:hypothetical protein